MDTTHLVLVEGELPPYRYTQSEIAAHVRTHLARLGSDGNRRVSTGVADRMAANSGVRHRSFSRPLEECLRQRPAADGSAALRRAAVEYGSQVLIAALSKADVRPEDVDVLLSTSYLAVGSPMWDVEVLRRAGLRPDVRRIPMNGLGCVGGVSLIARMHEYLQGHPDDLAVGLAAEPLFLLAGDSAPTMRRLAEWALFGDGSAALVMAGQRRARALPEGPAVVDSHGTLVPATQHMAGWYLEDDGFRTLLDPGLPPLVEASVKGPVDTLLARHGLRVPDIATWVCHAGSAKMLDAMARGLGLDEPALRHARDVLAHCGNMASVTVLHALRDTLADASEPGSWGVVLAVGPGLAYETVLFRYPQQGPRRSGERTRKTSPRTGPAAPA